MPSVTSSPKKAAEAGGDWQSLTITKAANGFEVRKCLPPKTAKNGMTNWAPDPPPYLFTKPGDLLDYVEKCVGPAEHYAHESAEGHPEAAKGKK